MRHIIRLLVVFILNLVPVYFIIKVLTSDIPGEFGDSLFIIGCFLYILIFTFYALVSYLILKALIKKKKRREIVYYILLFLFYSIPIVLLVIPRGTEIAIVGLFKILGISNFLFQLDWKIHLGVFIASCLLPICTIVLLNRHKKQKMAS